MYRLTRYHALAFMLLCLMVAAVLRLPDLPQAPPGLHYDEAANGVLAADIGLRGERPIFISSYTGKEVLFFYLAAGLMRVAGDSVFTLRLTAAYVGLLTVAATYWLAREMLADRRVAILAAALLAVSFWHLLFSRLGFRAIAEPLLQALTVAALFRGLRRNQTRWLVVAGVFLGLTGYTYLAARLFPVLLLVGSLPLLLDRHTFRRRWRQLALVAGVAFIVLLPLLIYFIGHPDAFWVRIAQVAPGAESDLRQGLLKALGMFFLVGDPFWRFNLPGRPLFNWLWGGLLIVGWLVSIIRWRRFPYDWQRAALLLLIAAPLVMLLPSALATGEMIPSNLRAIGLIPFIFLLPAVGVVILFHDIERRFRNPPVTFAVVFVGLLVLLSGGLNTYQLYFERWAAQTTLFYESDGDLAAVAAYLDATDLSGKTVYVAAPHYRHPTVAFLSAQYEAVKWLPDSQALVFPADGAALIVFPHNSPLPRWARPYLQDAPRVEAVPGFAPRDAFSAYEVDAPPELDFATAAAANFGNAITLLGYTVDAATAGRLPVTLFWRVDNRPDADFTPFVHLEDAWGHRWSQEETFAYPAEQWSPGERIVQRVTVPVPPGTPPGRYRLRVGLFDAAGNTRLPNLGENGRYAGDAFFIEDVAISDAPAPGRLPQPPFVVGETAVPGLRLLGYERGPATVSSGAPWGVALWWRAGNALPALTTQYVLVGGGSNHVLLETQPAHDTYPFSTWEPPAFVIDRQTLRIPADLTAGDYRLEMRLLDEQGEAVYTADLGPLRVEATERTFIVPEMDSPLDVVFGDEIALRGYDLATNEAGVPTLTLAWQALRAPGNDYTVFVHLLNADGACCLWQADAMPRQNSYPTSRWLPEEVVVDSYTIDLPADTPPGAYPLEIGLYVAETGQRLLLSGADANGEDALRLRPLPVE